MGKGGFRGIADILTSGAFSALMPDEKNEPASSGDLKQQAEKEAERKRIARAGAMSTKGQTMFTNPVVAGINPGTKTQFGQ